MLLRFCRALQQAIQWYDTARSLDPCAVEVIVAQGFTQHLAGHLDAAILLYHEVRSGGGCDMR